MRAALVLAAVVVCAPPVAWAENNEHCIELRCFCNGPDSSYTVASCSSNCYDTCGSSGGSSTTGQVRPAHVSRMFLGLIGGQGMSASYANGSSSRGDSQVGAQLEAAVGRPQFGLSVFFDLARDAGTQPDATTPEPMWLFDFGLGLVAAPHEFQFGRRGVRPELGIYGLNIIRTGCGERCNDDAGLGQRKPAEPNQGYLWRLRAGLDLYLWNTQGLSVDVLIQFGKIGDASDPLSAAELRPPRLLFRVAWIPVRDR